MNRNSMRVLLGATLLGAVLLHPPAVAQMSLKDYEGIQSGKSGVQDDFTAVYLAGILEGLQTANALAAAMGKAMFCVPQTERDPEVGDLKPLLDSAIQEAKAGRADFDRYARVVTVGLVSANTLASLYPCPNEADAAGAALGAAKP